MKSTRLARVAAIALMLGVAFGTIWFLTLRNYAESAFSSVQPHAPTDHFRSLECPATLALDQTDQITVEITNPLADDLGYQVAIGAPDFNIEMAPDSEITISGQGTARISWVIKPLTAGHHSITVSALSETDLSATGPYKLWSTSFQETCFVDVGASPGLSQERLILISGSMSVLSVVVGLAMW
ncbi:MAG TPA: hypothetical protein VIH26_05600, partial [Anaerolineales bacterium]